MKTAVSFQRDSRFLMQLPVEGNPVGFVIAERTGDMLYCLQKLIGGEENDDW